MGDDPTAEAIQWFDAEAEGYASRNRSPSEHIDDLLALLPPRARILDLGCGPARDAAALHARGHAVVGVDAAPGMVEVARRTYPGLDLRVADMRTLDLPPGSFDGILALYSLIFLRKAELPGMLARLARFLAPGGALLVAMQGGRPSDVGEDAFFSVTTQDEVLGLLGAAGFEARATWERPPRPDEMPFRKIHVLAARR